MVSPTQPVTLTVAQIEELSRQFSVFRHDVNGCLSLVVAASELIRYNPDVLKRMGHTLVEQPPKIAGKVQEFVQDFERALGLRDAAEASWHAALMKRNNLAANPPAHGLPLSPEHSRTLHSDLMALGKELTQLGFFISGLRALAPVQPGEAADALPNLSEQLTKTALKFDQFATKFEEVAQFTDTGPRRIGVGTPAGPVTLSAEQQALFHRRVLNLQRDLHEQLRPLLELSRLARHSPKELPPRAAEFSPVPPKISAELAAFGEEFDRMLGIARAA